MCITLGIMAIIFTNAALDTDGSLILKGNQGLIALVSANLYVIFFNASWGPVMWVMLGEMFPNQIRGSGLAISGFAQWISNFFNYYDISYFTCHNRLRRSLWDM